MSCPQGLDLCEVQGQRGNYSFSFKAENISLQDKIPFKYRTVGSRLAFTFQAGLCSEGATRSLHLYCLYSVILNEGRKM